MNKKVRTLMKDLRQMRAGQERSTSNSGSGIESKLLRLSHRFTKLSESGQTEKANKVLAEYQELMKVQKKASQAVSQSSMIDREVLIPDDPSNVEFTSVSGVNKAFALYDKLSKVLEKKLGKHRDVDEQSRRILLKMEELRERMAR